MTCLAFKTLSFLMVLNFIQIQNAKMRLSGKDKDKRSLLFVGRGEIVAADLYLLFFPIHFKLITLIIIIINNMEDQTLVQAALDKVSKNFHLFRHQLHNLPATILCDILYNVRCKKLYFDKQFFVLILLLNLDNEERGGSGRSSSQDSIVPTPIIPKTFKRSAKVAATP
jgi:hypothetical protein